MNQPSLSIRTPCLAQTQTGRSPLSPLSPLSWKKAWQRTLSASAPAALRRRSPQNRRRGREPMVPHKRSISRRSGARIALREHPRRFLGRKLSKELFFAHAALQRRSFCRLANPLPALSIFSNPLLLKAWQRTLSASAPAALRRRSPQNRRRGRVLSSRSGVSVSSPVSPAGSGAVCQWQTPSTDRSGA